MVKFVTTGELGATRDILYGFLPPYIRNPIGSHVSTLPVTLATIVMLTGEGPGRHELVEPAVTRMNPLAIDK